MSRFSFIIYSIFSAILFFTPAASAQTHYSLTGRLVYANGNGVSSVIVRDELGNLPNRTTNSQGYFTYAAVLEATEYKLNFEKRHHQFNPSNVQGIMPAENVILNNVTALVVTYSIHGTIIDDDTDEPIADVEVNAGILGTTSTNSQGKFIISSVPGDSNYSITFAKEKHKFQPATKTGFLGNADVHFSMIGYRVVSFSGHVRLTNLYESPLDGARVILQKIQGKGPNQMSALTDLEGYWLLDSVRRGIWEIRGEKEYHHITFLKDSVELVADTEDLIDLDFEAAPFLGNPVHATWESIFQGINILELVNTGPQTLTALIEMYEGSGVKSDQVSVSIPAYGQVDLIVNELKGFEPFSSGSLKITFDKEHFDGRMSYYKQREAEDKYDFGFSIPFSNPLSGRSYLNFNTNWPLNPNHDVLQFMSIVNVSPTPQTFTLRRYGINGNLLPNSFSGTLQPNQRFDLDGTYELSSDKIGLNEIIPANSNGKYLLQMIRLGTNSPDQDLVAGVAFAYALLGREGVGRIQHAPISRGGDASNFVEVSNVLTSSVNVKIDFLDNSGSPLGAPIYASIPAKAQRHYDASIYLRPGESGVARITPNKHKSIMGQSMFYFYDPHTREVNSMYGSSFRDSFNEQLTGSYNLFLGMYNWLKVFNLREEPTEISLRVALPSGLHTLRQLTLPARRGLDLGIHEGQTYGTQSNQYGLISIETPIKGAIFSELLRVRQLSILPPNFDFTAPTPMR